MAPFWRRGVLALSLLALASCSGEVTNRLAEDASAGARDAAAAPGADAGPGEVPDAQPAEPPDAGDDAGEEPPGPDAQVPEDAAAPGPDAATPLKVMTFNIQHAANSSLQDLADVILAEAPDLVGLNEVDVDADRSGNVDQPAVLGQLTGMEHAFAKTLTFSTGGQYGVALLSRLPILSTTPTLLTSSGEQRLVMVVEVQGPSGTLPVAVTHLGLTTAERQTQVGEILGVLSGRTSAVLMGDMNATPASAEMTTLAAAMTDGWQAGTGNGYTFPSDVPTKRIDYIYLASGWPAPLEARVVDTQASDHRPLVVRVPGP